ncbi:hypothetical protein DT250_24155 [Bacillus sp. AR2-1]|nr:hypothetical protein DT250_24155 [Bacillus sp. AR2-1]
MIEQYQDTIEAELFKNKLLYKGYRHTSINLRYIFIQNAVFSYSFLLSFIDFIKVGISNKP